MFINCLRNPTSTSTTANSKKHNAEKQPTLTAPLNPSSVPVSNRVWEGHSTFERGPAGNTLQIEKFYTSILQTLMDELRRRSVCQTLVEADGSSLNNPCTTVPINLVQHTKPSNTTSMPQRQETLSKAKPGHRIHLELK